MQPFGLFSLLQTLLDKPQAEDSSSPPPSVDATPAPAPPAEADAQKTDNRQAIVDFLTAHEHRAQKTRKR